MDDFQQSRPNSGVTPVERPPFMCSFELPKKSISEYGETPARAQRGIKKAGETRRAQLARAWRARACAAR
jgi:hypothetical protein